jgi:hypothetical protein
MPYAIIGLFVILIWAWITADSRDLGCNNDPEEDGFRVEKHGEVIVVMPTAQMQDTMLVIGGMYQSNPTWMFNQIPADLKRSRNIIIGPYTQSVQQTIVTGSDVLNRNLRVPYFTSMSGFSAGGARLSEYYYPNCAPLVVLMDPALDMMKIQKEWGAEVVILWGSDPMEDLYIEEYNYISDSVTEKGGVVEVLEIGHYEFPEYAFNKYQFSL